MTPTGKNRNNSVQINATDTYGTQERFNVWSSTWDSWYRNKPSSIYHADLQQRLQVASGMLLKARAMLPGSIAVVDVGCGTGNGTQAIASDDLTIYATDLASGMVHKAREQHPHIRVCVADAVKMPFRSKSFHLVMSLGTLEYIPLHMDALREFRRILQPGGILILSIPNRASLFRKLQRLGKTLTSALKWHTEWSSMDETTSKPYAYYHVSWNAREMSHLLMNAGFEVKERQTCTFGLLWPTLIEVWGANLFFCQWMNNRCKKEGWLANLLGCTSVLMAQAV
jgi:ubiquinone/menaquinone biosynthesis C-methylase UbiE